MKILWVNTGFLHPTTRGGQIRTLETLKQLHGRHEIHYAGLADPSEPEGPARSAEYCSHVRAVPFRPSPKNSLRFALQVGGGLFSNVPVTLARFHSREMKDLVERLIRAERFDAVVCDFLASAINFPSLQGAVLFQHNVETMIWRRLAANARDPVRRGYLRLQAARMFRYERDACRVAESVVAVSEADAELMRSMFGVASVTSVPTGVDTGYFTRPVSPEFKAHLVFLGSMDWMPNIDGVQWFTGEVLPLIRKEKPDCTFAIVGRAPPKAILELANGDPLTRVTGTVPDVRPWLWGARVSVVPLRVGGGTRLKIYEAMAAGAPVVSTAVGAEGLTVHPPRDIRIADSPAAFADECLRLLNDAGERQAVSAAALDLVRTRFSWASVAQQFEDALVAAAKAWAG